MALQLEENPETPPTSRAESLLFVHGLESNPVSSLQTEEESGQLRPLRGLQETRVATREESGILGFPSRRGLTPRGSLECNPEIPAFPGEEY